MTTPRSGSRTAACTIVSGRQIPFAKTLMASFGSVHPDWQQFVLVVDQPNESLSEKGSDPLPNPLYVHQLEVKNQECAGGQTPFRADTERFDILRESLKVVYISELPVPGLQKFLYRYTQGEAFRAAKPWFFRWLFETTGVDRVVYLDPTSYVYRPLAKVEEAMNAGALLVLIPKSPVAPTGERRAAEMELLRRGTYNLGFLGLARHTELKPFLTWWQNRLEYFCRDEPAAGLFVDQRWMDLALGKFEGVSIIRDQQYITDFDKFQFDKIERRHGEFCIDGRPIVACQFTEDVGPERLFLSYRGRGGRSLGTRAAHEFVREYQRAVISNGYFRWAHEPYAYGYLGDGTPISTLARSYYRETPRAQAEAGADPFQSDHAYLNRPWGSSRSPVVTELMAYAWRRMPELRLEFPNIDGASRQAYVDAWMAHLAGSLGIPERYRLTDRQQGSAGQDCQTQDTLWDRFKLFLKAAPKSLSEKGSDPLHYPVFSVQAGEDTRGWARGQTPFRTDSKPTVLRASSAVGGHGESSDAAKQTGQDGQQSPKECRSGIKPHSEFPHAVRIVTLSRDGVSQMDSGARAAMALRAMRLPFNTESLSDKGSDPLHYPVFSVQSDEDTRGWARGQTPFRTEAHSLAGGSESAVARKCTAFDSMSSASFRFNLLHLPPDHLAIVGHRHGLECITKAYNIGCWEWDEVGVPDACRHGLQHVREVWVPSRFLQDSLSRLSAIPIIRMPKPILLQKKCEAQRSSFGLPESLFLFLIACDEGQDPEQSNVLGGIAAFRRAFPFSKEVGLVVYVPPGNVLPLHIDKIRQALTGDPNAYFIDRAMAWQKLQCLQIVCDCRVSLHRSIGFGTGLAECMGLGKPVIATCWSGNKDYMTGRNSCPVRYRLIQSNGRQGPHGSELWADADLEHAAWYMRKLTSVPAYAGCIAAKGRNTIRARYSRHAVGRLYWQRLEVLARMEGLETSVVTKRSLTPAVFAQAQ